MSTTGRTGGGPINMWSRNTSPGGVEYWTRTDDPGYGYLDDPTKEGQQPGTARYPIDFIDYHYLHGPDDKTKRTKRTKVGKENRTLTASALEGRIPVAYGRVKIGASIIAWRAAGSILYESFALCHGPIHQFVGVEILNQASSLVGGSPFNSDALWQTEIGLANPVGAVPSYYSSATAAQGVERFPYLATAHGRFNLAGSLGIREAPKPVFTIDARTLRDPRLGVDGSGIPNSPEAFSKNPALALADYYTSVIYGPGVPDAGLDWDSVADAADYCDVLVAGLPRHTLNWAVMRTTSHRDVIETIKMLSRIRVIRRDGKRIFVPIKNATRVHTFTPDDSRPVQTEKVSLVNRPNTVKVVFTNPSKNYEDDPVIAQTSEAEAGTERAIIEEVQAEGLDNASEALRLANFTLAELRIPLLATLVGTGPEAQQYEPVDRIGYFSETALLGVDAGDPQDLRILRTQRHTDGTVRILSKYYYDPDDVTTLTTESAAINTTDPPTTTPDAPTAPSGASSLTDGDGLEEETYVPQNGTMRSRLVIDWLNTDWPYDLDYQVTAQKAGGSVVNVGGKVSSGPVFLDSTDDVTTYTICVYAIVKATGVTSVALSGTIATVNKTAPPADVLGLTGGANGNQVFLWWQPSSDADIDRYEIRRGTTADTWETALYDGQTKVTTWSDEPPYGGQVRYFVKAIDVAGRYSADAAAFNVTMAAIGNQQVAESNAPFGPSSATFTRVADGTGDANIGLWYGSGNLILEVCSDGGAGLGYVETAMLTRTFSPATAETERSAGAYASVGAWATAVDDPRRGGAGLWAPLPANAEGEIWGSGGPSRMHENRVRFGAVTHAGNDVPVNVSVAQPFFLDDITAPTVRHYGHTFLSGAAAATRGWGVRLSSNAVDYQQIVSTNPAGGFFVISKERKSAVFASGVATTDGTGVATVTYSYALAAIGNAWLSIRAVPAGSTFAAIVVYAVDTMGQSIQFKAYDATGAALPSLTFGYELTDNGAGTAVAWP